MNSKPQSDISLRPSDVVALHFHWEREGVATLEYLLADKTQKSLIAKTEDEKKRLVEFYGEMDKKLSELRKAFGQA